MKLASQIMTETNALLRQRELPRISFQKFMKEHPEIVARIADRVSSMREDATCAGSADGRGVSEEGAR